MVVKRKDFWIFSFVFIWTTFSKDVVCVQNLGCPLTTFQEH